MASLDEIYEKLEQERLRRIEEKKLAEQKMLEEYNMQRQFMTYEKQMTENMAVLTPVYFRFDIVIDAGEIFELDIEMDGDTKYTVFWGDLKHNHYISGQLATHTYHKSDNYKLIIFPLSVKSFRFHPPTGAYSGPKFSEFKNLTKLSYFELFGDFLNIDGDSFKNCPLKQLYFAESLMSGLTNSMFNGITTLQDFSWISGATIKYLESGIFSTLSNLTGISFSHTSFVNSVLVDNFLIDLDNNGLSNCRLVLNTNRTPSSDLAVSSMESRGCVFIFE